MSIKQEDVKRPTASFSPSVWGDQFLVYDQQEDQTSVEKEIEDLKEGVRKEIAGSLNIPTQHTSLIILVDAIERLGIDYYFEAEINQVLQHFYDLYGDHWNGGATSIWFRVMRQHCYFVSSGIFNSYKDKDGGFKEPLKDDIEGLLELYEATYLRVPGEVILDDALAYTRGLLVNTPKDTCLRNSVMFKHIQESLDHPLHKRVPRLEAVRYIYFYQQQTSHNKSLLKLAKLGFNLLQSLHKEELNQVYKWWKGFNVPTNIPYTRNRLVECYFWALSILFEPQYSESRMFLAKFLSMETLLDDTYDAYGTLEELEIFTEAVKRSSPTCLDDSPESMKLVYRMVEDMYEGMEKVLMKMGKAHHLKFSRKAMVEHAESYLEEAKWANNKYMPTVEEHKQLSMVSCGYINTLVASFLAMGDVITDETFKWALTMPPFARTCCILCRAMDDIETHKEEQERMHVASGIQCYMKEYNVTEQHGSDLLSEKVEEDWKEMNLEALKCKDVEMPVIMRLINMTRVMSIMYKNKDHFTHPDEVLINHIRSVVVDAIVI